jgi:DMSO/TMAO reductase YedYZ molybdopterin-dependent catalytic subunit
MTTTQARRSQFTPHPGNAKQGLTPRAALIGSVLATGLAGLGMLVLRTSLQVRSVPERVMEWLLLFISPDQFESALQRFGFDAKRYGLYLAALGMLAILCGLGYLALRHAWPLRAIAALGVGLWLFVMVVIMPLTSAGFFAGELLDGRRAAIGGYLAVGLTFAAVLAGARVLEFGPSMGADVSRRAALGLAGSAAGMYVATFLLIRLFPRTASVASVILEDPQEPVPSGGIDAPNPHPNVVATEPAPNAVAGSTPGPAAAATPRPTASSGMPEPPPPRVLTRDKDGAVLPVSRKPGQLTPPVTDNNDFYVVTKNAAGDPTIHPEDWRLLIDGDVDRPFQLDYATLRKMPTVEVTKTLECISNFVGKPELAPFGAELISTAVWKGVRVRDILGLVGGPKSDAAWVAVLSADEYTSALPLDVVMDPGTVLVYEMNGEVLPREHGYPARLLVPDRYGMKNAKWVVGLRPMRREFTDWYGQRNWSKTGVLQTMVRIDTPAANETLPSGSQTIAGIAYAGTRGIQKVEFSADDGQSWEEAELLEQSEPGQDRWVRWRGTFSVAGGETVALIARATDGAGELQTEAFSLPEPNGSTGWPRIEVHAG